MNYFFTGHILQARRKDFPYIKVSGNQLCAGVFDERIHFSSASSTAHHSQQIDDAHNDSNSLKMKQKIVFFPTQKKSDSKQLQTQ